MSVCRHELHGGSSPNPPTIPTLNFTTDLYCHHWVTWHHCDVIIMTSQWCHVTQWIDVKATYISHSHGFLTFLANILRQTFGGHALTL